MKGAAMGCCGLWEATQLTLQRARSPIALLAAILLSPPGARHCAKHITYIDGLL